jgi:HJR/Mrr/RecB family endonuclease
VTPGKDLERLNTWTSRRHEAQTNVGMQAIDLMVGREGFKPSTIGLKVQKGD